MKAKGDRMILAIDVGNTNITIAVLRDGEVEALSLIHI